MKVFLNIVKYVFFLAIGAGLFWLIYREQDINEIKDAFREVNYWWIGASLIFSILSIVSRARRWQLLINSIGYKPRYANVFLSCYVLYLVNMFIPRAGEVARCSVVASTDKVPFPKLVGTVIIERMADFIMLALIAVVIFAVNVETLLKISDAYPELHNAFEKFTSPKYLALFAVLLIVGFFAFKFYRSYRKKKNANTEKKESIFTKFLEGIDSISRLERKWEFVAHTLFIFLMWLAMLYVVFLAVDSTAHLSVRAGMLTFLMGGLAMLVPAPGGIGPWHAMVALTLTHGYGILSGEAEIFALIAHTTTNLVYIILGAIALVVIFIINSGNVKLSNKTK